MVKLVHWENHGAYEFCIHGSEDCKHTNTVKKTIISLPFPEILILELGWSTSELGLHDLLKTYVSMNHYFYLDEIYTMPAWWQERIQYEIRAICCYAGAHYVSIVKSMGSDGKPEWRFHNDESTEVHREWEEVLRCIIEFRGLPTLLFYQKLEREDVVSNPEPPLNQE